MEVGSPGAIVRSALRRGTGRIAVAALLLGLPVLVLPVLVLPVLVLPGVILAGPAVADPVAISDDKPAVRVDVPPAFVSKGMQRGVQLKTPDGEVFVWFETFGPDEIDALIKEHNDYWAKQGVSLGTDIDRFEKDFGGKKVVATDYKGATWNGKPTVIRYLAVDANLASQKRVLMSIWASPDGDKAHDAEVMDMIGSLRISE